MGARYSFTATPCRRHVRLGSIEPPSLLNVGAFRENVQPLLANVTTSTISTALGVSWVYASHIRAGAKRPSTAVGEAGGTGGVFCQPNGVRALYESLARKYAQPLTPT